MGLPPAPQVHVLPRDPGTRDGHHGGYGKEPLTPGFEYLHWSKPTPAILRLAEGKSHVWKKRFVLFENRRRDWLCPEAETTKASLWVPALRVVPSGAACRGGWDPGPAGPPSASLGEAGQGAVRGDTLQLCVSTDRRACREAPEAAWGESRLPLHPARLQAGLEAESAAMGRAGASSPALAARPCTHLVLPAPRESP